MILLVTGGKGFIGSHFIRLVLGKRPAWKVVDIDRLNYAGNLENLRDVEETEGGKRYFFLEGDICDAPLVDSILGGDHPLFRQDGLSWKGPDSPISAVVHFAAESHVDRSIRDPSAFYRTNVEGTRVLVESARRHWKPKAPGSTPTLYRLLQVSTDEVYGSLGPDDPPFREDSPIRPNSPYAASKAAADLMVLAYFHTYGLPAVVTRCGNNYGSYQHPEKFIPLFITNAIEDRPLPLYGDGLQVRDWIHVDDHCRALLAILEHGKPGEVYNIGANEERSNLQVAELILRILEKSRHLIRGVIDRSGHDRRYALDVAKLKSVSDWRAERSFEEGLESTIRWYQNHDAWWRGLKNDQFWQYYKAVYGSI